MELNEIVLKAKNPVKKIIFIFHGYGANKENLLPVGEMFSNDIDDVEVHLADGIQRCDYGFGYQWFPFGGNDIDVFKAAYYKIEENIKKYIDDTIKSHDLSYNDVVLCGFSQGGMISLMLGLKLKVSGVVSFSGVLLDSDAICKNDTTKVFMTHGALDSVIPVEEVYKAKEHLEKNEISVETMVSETTEHSIEYNMINEAVRFIKSLD